MFGEIPKTDDLLTNAIVGFADVGGIARGKARAKWTFVPYALKLRDVIATKNTTKIIQNCRYKLKFFVSLKLFKGVVRLKDKNENN